MYTDSEQSAAVNNLVQALDAPKQWVFIGSNDDPGWEGVNHALRVRASELGRFGTFMPSMRFEFFVTLLENSKMIIGNSSCGIMEAPVLGIPTLNIGPRQDGRAKDFGLKSITNVLDTTASEISHAIDTYWGRKHKPNMEFGTGESGYKFAQLLVSEDAWNISRQKQFIQRSWKESPKYSKRRYV